MRHFLDLTSVSRNDLAAILQLAHTLKKQRKEGISTKPLLDKKLAMIFEKNSTRTRVSFEVGMMDLGGQAIYLSGRDMQIGRGESIADTAKVLSRYVDVIMLRCHSHQMLTDLAEYSTVPVINGLTDFSHPCQIMADIMTYEEHRGALKGKKVTWVGDGNNVCNSFISAAPCFDYSLSIACPAELMPDKEMLAWSYENGGKIEISHDPVAAVKDAHLVVTDTWVSMGDSDSDRRTSLLLPYQVNQSLMGYADKGAVFMHCLPAHREEEVTSEVIDGPQSVVWDEAENRLHIQKAILLWCLNKL